MDFSKPVSLSDTDWVLVNQANAGQLSSFSQSQQQLKIISANLGTAKPTGKPVAVDGKVAMGLDNGQFVLIAPSTGAQAGAPYQPSLVPGKKVSWNPPLYLEGAKTIIVANDQLKLARLSGQGSLRALTEKDLEFPLDGPLAIVDARVAAVQKTETEDELICIDPTSLEIAASLTLDARRVSGPFSLEDGAIVQTARGLVKFDQEANVLWESSIRTSALVGRPLLLDDKMVVATKSGELWVLAADTGEVIGNVHTRQPFASAPQLQSGGVLIGGEEGVVLALPLPTELLMEGR